MNDNNPQDNLTDDEYFCEEYTLRDHIEDLLEDIAKIMFLAVVIGWGGFALYLWAPTISAAIR